MNVTEIRCVITWEGSQAVSQLKGGRPLDEIFQNEFIDEDRTALAPAVGQSDSLANHPTSTKGFWSEAMQVWFAIHNAKLGPATSLCFGLALVVLGIQFVNQAPPLHTWGLLLIVLGATSVVGWLGVMALPFRNAKSAFGWVPIGVWGVVLLPMWLFVPGAQSTPLLTYYWAALLVLGVLFLISRS